jgi:hypothetical protein
LDRQELQSAGQPSMDPGVRQARIDAEVKRILDNHDRQYLTDKQIDARAWAASRNQVFTDPYHVEASRDNSNQALSLETAPDGSLRVVKAEVGVEIDGTVRPIRDAEGRTRTAAGVLEAQRSRVGGLGDSESYASMWKVKSADYADGNMPEAVAQTQKWVKQHIKLMEGKRLAGGVVPPLKPHVADAIDLIVRAPSDATATPQRMQELDQAIRAIRRPDPSGMNPDGIQAYPGGVKEAMEKLPEQDRILGMTRRMQSIAVPEGEGGMAADAVRGGMRSATGPAMSVDKERSPSVQPLQTTGGQNPDDLEEKIRRLDEERARLARKIAESRQQTKGEHS